MDGLKYSLLKLVLPRLSPDRFGVHGRHVLGGGPCNGFLNIAKTSAFSNASCLQNCIAYIMKIDEKSTRGNDACDLQRTR